MSMLAGVHRGFDLLYAARSRISRTCAGPSILRGLRGTQGVAIACLRDAVEMLGPDLDLVQAARHAEAADEIVEHVAGVLARMPHRGGDQRLPLGIDRFVPAHHDGSITQEV